MDIDLSTDAVPSPGRTLHLAETLASIVRCLNHDTRHREALRYPSDADRVIRELAAAASRLPQLLGQVSRWLDGEYEEGRVGLDGSGDVSVAVLQATARLESASQYASLLGAALDRAASLTSGMTAAEDGSDRCGR